MAFGQESNSKKRGSAPLAGVSLLALAMAIPGPLHAQVAAPDEEVVQPAAPSEAADAAAPETASQETAAPEEIVVTATKQGAVALQRVPASIDVVTGTLLEDRNVRSAEDLARLTPSLNFVKSGDGDLQFIIRGIQSPGESTVGFYLDETVINGVNFGSGGGRTPDIGAYDVERVEVLKGPQGTLFGASSMSGTVRVITNKPNTRRFSGTVSGSVSGTKDGGTNHGFDAMLNVPLVPGVLGLRGVLWHDYFDGYVDGYFGVNGVTFVKDANKSKKTGGRLQARLTPVDWLTIDGFYTRQELQVDGPSEDVPLPSGTLAPITIVSGPPFLRGRIVPPSTGGLAADRVFTDPTHESAFNMLQIYGATAQIDTSVGNIVATASHYDLLYEPTFALTGSGVAFGLVDIARFRQTGELVPIGAVVGDQTNDRNLFSSEVRFNSTFAGPFNFVVGGSYNNDERNGEMTVKVGDAITGKSLCRTHQECIADVNSPGARSLIYSTGSLSTVKAYALFANGDYKLTDRLTLNGGLRYFKAKLHDIAFANQAFQGSIPPVTPPAYGGPVQLEPTIGLDARDTQSKLTWSGTVSYKLDQDKLLYARAATGFRQGGINNFNSAAQLGIIVPKTFEPDTVLSLELGSKMSFFDRRLTVNAALFRMLWDNMQVPGSDPTGAVDYIANGANAKIDGVELEVSARPVTGLTLTAGATYLSPKLRKDQTLEDEELFVELPPIGRAGDRIPRVPKFTLAATATYRLPWSIIGGTTTTLDGSLNHTSSYATAFNDDYLNFQKLGAVTTMNAGVNVEAGPVMVRLFANNLTDEVGPELDRGIVGSNVISRPSLRPRTIGLLTRFRF
jgi:outer membrane receptor protein involved in Fe transport